MICSLALLLFWLFFLCLFVCLFVRSFVCSLFIQPPHSSFDETKPFFLCIITIYCFFLSCCLAYLYLSYPLTASAAHESPRHWPMLTSQRIPAVASLFAADNTTTFRLSTFDTPMTPGPQQSTTEHAMTRKTFWGVLFEFCRGPSRTNS